AVGRAGAALERREAAAADAVQEDLLRRLVAQDRPAPGDARAEHGLRARGRGAFRLAAAAEDREGSVGADGEVGARLHVEDGREAEPEGRALARDLHDVE